MSEEEFAYALRELRGEYTAPSEVAEVCARLFEEQQRENGILRARHRPDGGTVSAVHIEHAEHRPTVSAVIPV